MWHTHVCTVSLGCYRPHTARTLPYCSCAYYILLTYSVNFRGCAQPALYTGAGYVRQPSCARKSIVKSKYVAGLSL